MIRNKIVHMQKVKVSLERPSLYNPHIMVRGYVIWDSDHGLQVGMIDPKTGCRIVDLEYHVK